MVISSIETLPSSKKVCNSGIITKFILTFFVSYFNKGKRGAICGKRLTFLYTNPYEHTFHSFVFKKSSEKNIHNLIRG